MTPQVTPEVTRQDNSSFLAACLQLCSSRNVIANRDALVRGIRAAAAHGVQFIQTPEMTNLLERDRAALFEKVTSQEHDVVLQAACEEARRAQLYVHIGSLGVGLGDKVANRAFVIDPEGQIIAHYDKMHLFDVDLPQGESWRESATYTAGDEVVLASLPWGKLGLSICYDLRFPNLYQALAQQGASFLSAPAAFTRQTGHAHWEVLQRARAIETGSFMISAAQAGVHEDGRETYGHSLIIDPWGRILAQGGATVSAHEASLIIAKIDTSLVAQARSRIPTLKHARIIS